MMSPQDLGDPIVNLLLVILKEKKVLFISPCLRPPSSFGSILLLGLYKQYQGTDFHGSKGVERLIDFNTHIHLQSLLVQCLDFGRHTILILHKE